MNYIGSKRKLVPFIKEQITKSIKIPLKEATFCDLFAGTGIVGRSFKSDVRTVLSNDIEYYSFILNANYIQNNHSINNQTKLIESLNNLPPIKDGFIYNNYCLGSGSQREYFSDLNGQKIDTIREHIKQLKKDQKIDTVSYYFLLASLIESADKVANTASVYGAHLKHLKKTAQKELIVQPALFEIAGENHQVFQEDSNALVRKIKGDILYIDPPYNHRQYGANYHLLNTIALYDHFIPKGKSGLREYTKSAYCKKNEATDSFDDLIKNAHFPYIFVSYNNEGIMDKQTIQSILSKYGKYSCATKVYQRFKADKSEHRAHKYSQTKEYLHMLQKRL